MKDILTRELYACVKSIYAQYRANSEEDALSYLGPTLTWFKYHCLGEALLNLSKYSKVSFIRFPKEKNKNTLYTSEKTYK